MLDILTAGEGIGPLVSKLLAAESGTCLALVARDEGKLGIPVVQLPGTGHDFIAADLSQPEGIDLVARPLAARHCN